MSLPRGGLRLRLQLPRSYPAAILQLSRSYPTAIPQLPRSYPAAIPQLSRSSYARDETPAVRAVTVLRKPCVWVAQLHLVEERHSSAFEREGSVPRGGATPAMDAEAEGARGERGEQEASPASPASPASESERGSFPLPTA